MVTESCQAHDQWSATVPEMWYRTCSIRTDCIAKMLVKNQPLTRNYYLSMIQASVSYPEALQKSFPCHANNLRDSHDSSVMTSELYGKSVTTLLTCENQPGVREGQLPISHWKSSFAGASRCCRDLVWGNPSLGLSSLRPILRRSLEHSKPQPTLLDLESSGREEGLSFEGGISSKEGRLCWQSKAGTIIIPKA